MLGLQVLHPPTQDIKKKDIYDSKYFNIFLQAAINYRALPRTEYLGKLDWEQKLTERFQSQPQRC